MNCVGVVRLADFPEAVRAIQQRISGRRYWVFPCWNDRSRQLAGAIQQAFYADPPASDDWAAVIFPGVGPGGSGVTIITAAKEHAPYAALEPVLPYADFRLQSDVICAGRPPELVIVWLTDTFNWGPVLDLQ